MDILTEISHWAKTAFPEPDKKQYLTQTGCHAEEFGEMLEALANMTKDNADEATLSRIGLDVQRLATLMKQKKIGYEPTDPEARLALLDSLCDQIVTAVVLADLLGMDIQGALKEINSSNFSKFLNNTTPIYDENGKLKKGPDYFKPSLASFI